MKKRMIYFMAAIGLSFSLAACGAAGQPDAGTPDMSEESGYESVEGTQIKMITENTDVLITLNDSRAAADLVAMLPLELALIERNSFAKGMTLPEHLSAVEETTREYEIGDFGYWNAGPDLAIFYDDIYEKTIVDVIPLGHAQSGAEAMADEAGRHGAGYLQNAQRRCDRTGDIQGNPAMQEAYRIGKSI